MTLREEREQRGMVYQFSDEALFDLYNKEKILNDSGWTQLGNAYLNYSKLPDVGIASDCIECEACLEECPQQINIPEVLKDVAKTFETEEYGFTD